MRDGGRRPQGPRREPTIPTGESSTHKGTGSKKGTEKTRMDSEVRVGSGVTRGRDLRVTESP